MTAPFHDPTFEAVHDMIGTVLEGSPVPTLVIDAEHRVVMWNKACSVLTGLSADDMVGTREQWRAFYPSARPIMADMIVAGALSDEIDVFYHGKFQHSQLIAGAYEAEDFFPNFGDDGRWLFFTAAPIRDGQGKLIGAIETLQDVTARRRAEQRLRDSEERYRTLSLTDALTGLFNSRHMYEALQREIERAVRYRRPLALIVLDADHFKRVNDRFGHAGGDVVLQELAACILGSLRRSDTAFRFGGEEFAVLLPETTLDTATLVAERIRRRFAGADLHPVPHETIRCTISLGVTELIAGDTPKTLLKRADDGSYQAKHRGRNQVVAVPSPMDN